MCLPPADVKIRSSGKAGRGGTAVSQCCCYADIHNHMPIALRMHSTAADAPSASSSLVVGPSTHPTEGRAPTSTSAADSWFSSSRCHTRGQVEGRAWGCIRSRCGDSECSKQHDRAQLQSATCPEWMGISKSWRPLTCNSVALCTQSLLAQAVITAVEHTHARIDPATLLDSLPHNQAALILEHIVGLLTLVHRYAHRKFLSTP
jgi:hypothetical protein